MNVLDSELVAASLIRAGYEQVDSARAADTILFNTCSVRQHAEDKIYSALGRLKDVKKQHPQKIIGVLGCMAQKDQEQILDRAPHVDLVVGPGQLAQLPLLLEQVARGEGQKLEVSLDRQGAARRLVEASFAHFDPSRDARPRAVRHQAMVRIMFGCDKFCSYCIVPKVAWARAKPAAGRNRGRSATVGRRRMRRGDAAGQNRQQLPQRIERQNGASGRSFGNGSARSTAFAGCVS